MKRIVFISAIVFAYIMMATSCVKTNFKSQIAQVDSLENVLVGYSFAVDTIDVVLFDSIGSHTKNILAALHAYYDERGEELPLEDGIVFGNFKAVKKGVKNFTERLTNIKKEIAYSNSQLNTLKSDMEAGAIEKELAKQYYSEEKHAIEILSKEINSLVKGLSFAASRYNKMLPEIKLKMEQVGIADSVAW